jgi:hypothetical protein
MEGQRIVGPIPLRKANRKLQVPPLRFAPVGMTKLGTVALPEQMLSLKTATPPLEIPSKSLALGKLRKG